MYKFIRGLRETIEIISHRLKGIRRGTLSPVALNRNCLGVTEKLVVGIGNHLMSYPIKTNQPGFHMPVKVNIIINALPKSASLFITRVLCGTFGSEHFRIGTRGFNSSQVKVERATEFISNNNAVAQDHLAPTTFNIKALKYCGINKIVVLFRDPRAALVSWAHHLERDDAKNVTWHRALLIAGGVIPENYYELSWDSKLTCLANSFYPLAIEWMLGWEELSQEPCGIDIKIATYEKFVKNDRLFFEDLLEFYDIEFPSTGLIWPSILKNGSIDLNTHFRKGIVNSYNEELTTEQFEMINNLANVRLFKKYGWKI